MLIKPARDFRAELAVAARTPRFWAIVARNAIPAVGVLAFGWPALHVALYFLAESWLFLSLRAAIEITIDPKFGGSRAVASTRSFPVTLFQHFLVAGAIMALVVGGLGAFAVGPAFPEGDWEGLLAGGYREPTFLAVMAVLAVVSLADAARFARDHEKRSAAQAKLEDERIATMFYRVLALVFGSFALGFATRLGFGPQALVLAIMGVMIWFEGLPAHALAHFDHLRRR